MNCNKDADDKAVYDDKVMIKNTAQKMETETADLVIFTEEILHGKLHFLCIGISIWHHILIKYLGLAKPRFRAISI